MRSNEPRELFLVGIAASAGGLQPMCDLLQHASCHGSMAFVIVSHVDRHRKNDMAKILERASRLKALEIEDGMSIEHCHLYTIPPNQYVTLAGSKFSLQPRPPQVPNEVANVFFESLSETYGENAIGVVLLGAAVGADGAKGVRELKKRGGHTYAQQPETADFPAMPKLAIETGCVDSIYSPEQIGLELSLVSWNK